MGSEMCIRDRSVGVQALNNIDLKRLGRLHSATEAINAIEISNSIFSQTSFDLIYARQEQQLMNGPPSLKEHLNCKPAIFLYTN